MESTVDEWLKSLHLHQYQEAFRDAGYIMLDQCCHLTEDKLEALGIILPGHKKRILVNLPTTTANRSRDLIGSGLYDNAFSRASNASFMEEGYANFDGTKSVNDNIQTLGAADVIPPLPPKLRSRQSGESFLGSPRSSAEDVSSPSPVAPFRRSRVFSGDGGSKSGSGNLASSSSGTTQQPFPPASFDLLSSHDHHQHFKTSDILQPQQVTSTSSLNSTHEAQQINTNMEGTAPSAGSATESGSLAEAQHESSQSFSRPVPKPRASVRDKPRPTPAPRQRSKMHKDLSISSTDVIVEESPKHQSPEHAPQGESSSRVDPLNIHNREEVKLPIPSISDSDEEENPVYCGASELGLKLKAQGDAELDNQRSLRDSSEGLYGRIWTGPDAKGREEARSLADQSRVLEGRSTSPPAVRLEPLGSDYSDVSLNRFDKNGASGVCLGILDSKETAEAEYTNIGVKSDTSYINVSVTPGHVLIKDADAKTDILKPTDIEVSHMKPQGVMGKLGMKEFSDNQTHKTSSQDPQPQASHNPPLRRLPSEDDQEAYETVWNSTTGGKNAASAKTEKDIIYSEIDTPKPVAGTSPVKNTNAVVYSDVRESIQNGAKNTTHAPVVGHTPKVPPTLVKKSGPAQMGHPVKLPKPPQKAHSVDNVDKSWAKPESMKSERKPSLDSEPHEPTFAPPPLPREYSGKLPSLPPRPAMYRPTPLAHLQQELQSKMNAQKKDTDTHGASNLPKEPSLENTPDPRFSFISTTSVAPRQRPQTLIRDFDPLFTASGPDDYDKALPVRKPPVDDEVSVYCSYNEKKATGLFRENRSGSVPTHPPPPPPRDQKPTELMSVHFEPLHSFDDSGSYGSVWESDDTLSDGGDFVDDGALYVSSTPSEPVPIVPATPTKTCEKSGYLLKNASKSSNRAHRLGWQSRWVVFRETSLSWYSNEKSRISKRIIPTSSMVSVEQVIGVADGKANVFKVITVDRVYRFAAETHDDMVLWASTIMHGILNCQTPHREGGDMYMPDKEGMLRIDGVKGQRYLAVKKDKFCYYNTQKDFRAGCPIHCVEMNIATVKDLGRNRLQLITPYAKYTFLCDNMIEMLHWKTAFEIAIAEGLADDSVMREIYRNTSNRMCADCGAPEPHWASINFGITLCQHCAGIHRELQNPASKVKSLRMDMKVWTSTVKQLMYEIGNTNSNNFWEWNTTADTRIDADVDMSQRENYILSKYEQKAFCKFHRLKYDVTALNEALCEAVKHDDLLETSNLIFSGAQLACVSYSDNGEPQTPLQIAKAAGKDIQVELLLQNGAEECLRIQEEEENLLNQVREENQGATRAMREEIVHTGFLHKTGGNRKEFLKRWCVLKNGILSYYETDKSVVARDNILEREMVGVSKSSADKFPYAFELSTRKNGRIYLFAAEYEPERRDWMKVLGQTIAKTSRLPSEDMDMGATLHMKMGATEEWRQAWVQLEGKTLYVVDKDSHAQQVDLRMTTISQVTEDTCLNVWEHGSMFVVDDPTTKQAIYLQGGMRRDTEQWLKVLQAAVLSTGGTLDMQQLTKDLVPVIVDTCISYIQNHGEKEEGIYRRAGQNSKVASLLDSLKKDARSVAIRQDDYQVHDVANALKRFFRGLDEPLLTERLYPNWIRATEIQDPEAKKTEYRRLLSELPSVNHCTLRLLLYHLSRIVKNESVNKMGVMQVALSFGSGLLTSEKMAAARGIGNNAQEMAVVHDLLEGFDSYFTRDDDGKDEIIQKAMKKLRDAEEVKDPAGDFIIGVLLFDAHGDSEELPVQVPINMISGDLVDRIVEKKNLDGSQPWGLFEMVSNRELERPLHPSERVLEVTMRWSSWPQEFTQRNCLCLKINAVYEELERVFEPHRSLFSEMKMSTKRNFKTFYFTFSQAKLSYHKDPKSAEVEPPWEVEKLLVYLGVPSKRAQPPQLGFTLLLSDEAIKNYFGRSILCTNKEEYYRWLAGMMFAKYPQGLKSRTGTLTSSVNNTVSPPSEKTRKGLFGMFQRK